MKKLVALLSILSFINVNGQIRIACIGASITEGAGTGNPSLYSYPAQLQTLLGYNYKVMNFGVSSSTLLKNGNAPYRNTQAYQSALQSNPSIVFIDLGGNDAKLINRKFYSELEADCTEMINAFNSLPSHPRVILLLPFVSFETDTNQIWDKKIMQDIIPAIQSTAYNNNTELLDVHSLLINRPELFPDKIHPTKEGAAVVSERLYRYIQSPSSDPFDIFQKLKQPYTVSNFAGYACADFKLNGRDCKIAKPKHPHPSHPFIWRARFWGHEPQTDIALLENGFHVVYCDVAELLGNKQSNQYWNQFYDLLTDAGLSKKAVMEGMSRGGVYVFSWAAGNPTKVAAVYVDNPLLNTKDWAMRTMRSHPQHTMLRAFQEDFDIKDSAALSRFGQSPVDQVKKIVKGKYPILIVCADEDEAVDPETNTNLFEKKIRKLKGDITVIHKPGFKHHPHSLPNPKPIVDFILQATLTETSSRK